MDIGWFLRRKHHLTAALATAGVLGVVIVVGLVRRVDPAPSIPRQPAATARAVAAIPPTALPQPTDPPPPTTAPPATAPPATDPRAQTLASLRKVDEHPLYTMTYYGDYPVKLPTGVASAPAEAAPWGCSLFVTFADPAHVLFGRNFDWDDHPALLLFTDPPDGYAAVSMVDISYLGFDHHNLVELETLDGRAPLLRAPLLPFDGMNEHGLTVGMAAVDPSPFPNDPRKPTIGSLRIIRVLLDRARTTQEALDLISGYNIDFTGGPPIHYLIADRTGHAAVVEYRDGAMQVVRNDRPWLAATNFYLAGASAAQRGQDERFAMLDSALNRASGVLSAQAAMDLLAAVAQHHTRWSVVYDLTTGDIHLAMAKRYNRLHSFKLPSANLS
ncbi:MAG TPA: C45 family peptidase [Roseiflexaceae bacterium]|nr:C45 family peptidase [Roseiflexaceae bacterium]